MITYLILRKKPFQHRSHGRSQIFTLSIQIRPDPTLPIYEREALAVQNLVGRVRILDRRTKSVSHQIVDPCPFSRQEVPSLGIGAVTLRVDC